MPTLLDRLRGGSQAISVPTCQTVLELERSVITGIALVHLDDLKTYVSLFDTRFASGLSAERLTFTGWCRASQREVACCVEVDRQTLQGYLRLCNTVQTGSDEQ